MKYFKKILKSLIITILIILILTLVMTSLNYFNIISGKVMIISKIIIPLVSLAVGGFILGKEANKNGWLEGLKLGLIIILLIIIGNLIFTQSLTFKDLIFYLLLLFSSMLGSMFGINIQKK